ncbi:MAG: hypothetical protein ACD_2C00241G0002 [uncultured bacterium (gcode 4)]|uniref:Uncharacterized protein n=1 Tax=uncultured bacterium (gcode 4) TaxID=1234023 RepID=K2GFG3_9BACT|nr:MAG: hypothetical protein ACD_2C00241G0002 [uncultured bacterium (gcode 4)]
MRYPFSWNPSHRSELNQMSQKKLSKALILPRVTRWKNKIFENLWLRQDWNNQKGQYCWFRKSGSHIGRRKKIWKNKNSRHHQQWL